MAIDNVKLLKTVNKLSLFTGPVISTTSGGGGGVSNGRTTNIEKAIGSGYVVTAGYAPFYLLGATASHGVTLWTAPSGGTQITTIKDWTGTTVGSISTDVDGGVFFQIADTNNVVYADLGSTRIKINRVFTIIHGHVIADVTGLQTALDAKSDTTHNHNATYQALSGKDVANGYAGTDSGNKILAARIPDISTTYVAVATKGVASGVGSLDGTGTQPSAEALVKSVNGFVGTVALVSGDVGSYSQAEVDAFIAGVSTGLPAIIEVSGVYPLRSTATSSSTIPVVWIGPDAPTIGSGYALNNVDIWFVKA